MVLCQEVARPTAGLIDNRRFFGISFPQTLIGEEFVSYLAKRDGYRGPVGKELRAE